MTRRATIGPPFAWQYIQYTFEETAPTATPSFAVSPGGGGGGALFFPPTLMLRVRLGLVVSAAGAASAADSFDRDVPSAADAATVATFAVVDCCCTSKPTLSRKRCAGKGFGPAYATR